MPFRELCLEEQPYCHLVVHEFKKRRQRTIFISDLDSEELRRVPIQGHDYIVASILPHPHHFLAGRHPGRWIGNKLRDGERFGREGYSRNPRPGDCYEIRIIRVLDGFAEYVEISVCSGHKASNRI